MMIHVESAGGTWALNLDAALYFKLTNGGRTVLVYFERDKPFEIVMGSAAFDEVTAHLDGVAREQGKRSSFRAFDSMMKRASAKNRGYEDEACRECGNFTLVRNGDALKCNRCGGCQESPEQEPGHEPDCQTAGFNALKDLGEKLDKLMPSLTGVLDIRACVSAVTHAVEMQTTRLEALEKCVSTVLRAVENHALAVKERESASVRAAEQGQARIIDSFNGAVTRIEAAVRGLKT